MPLVERLERMLDGRQSALSLNRDDAQQILKLLRLNTTMPLGLFLSAIEKHAIGLMDRAAVDFMVDELVLKFQDRQVVRDADNDAAWGPLVVRPKR